MLFIHTAELQGSEAAGLLPGATRLPLDATKLLGCMVARLHNCMPQDCMCHRRKMSCVINHITQARLFYRISS